MGKGRMREEGGMGKGEMTVMMVMVVELNRLVS